MNIDIGIETTKRQEIANGLSRVLADSYTLYPGTYKQFSALSAIKEEAYSRAGPGARHPGHPLGCDVGLGAQRGHAGVRHGDGAAVAGLHLGRHVEEGGARRMRTRARIAPRKGMASVLDGQPHQVVPMGVELDFVDPVAEAIVGAQDRRMLLGESPPRPSVRRRR